MAPPGIEDEEGRSLVNHGAESADEFTENSNNSGEFCGNTAQHLDIDPYAVDFQPVFTGFGGNAVNYHSQESFHHGEKESSQYLGLVREKLCLLLEYSLYISRRILPFSRPSSSKVPPAKEGTKANKFNRYVMFGMGFLVFVVITFTQMHSVTSHKTEGTTVFKFLTQRQSGGVIPPDIEHAYRDTDDLPLFYLDTPIFWHIPRSAGITMERIMSTCMGLNVTNVDALTPGGIEHAAIVQLIQSRKLDVVVTSQPHAATKLFDKHHQGRLFTLLRDPVERLASLYYFLQMRHQETSTGQGISKGVSLEQFAEKFSDNWMVRTLTNTMEGPLNQGHLNVAKEILRAKFLIGILEDKQETLRRIEAYFGWKLTSPQAQNCRDKLLYFEPRAKNIHDAVVPNSREFEILKNRNHFDVELYEYARMLFKEQNKFVPQPD